MAGNREDKTKRDRDQNATSDDRAVIRPIRPAPIKIPEGGDENLRRRAEWFRKRQGQS